MVVIVFLFLMRMLFVVMAAMASMIMVVVLMMVTAAAFVIMLVVLMVMTAAAFVIMLVVLMVMTAAAFMIVVAVFMMVAAAAFMVMVVVLMVVAAAALVIMVVVFMVMTAAALVIMVMMLMVMTAAARMIVMRMLPCWTLTVSGIDLHFPFHCPGKLNQFRNQGIRILCRQPQLLGGKGDDGLLHTLMIVEFLFDFCCAVGAVQIVNDVYFSGHGCPSCLFQHMSNRSSVFSIPLNSFLVNIKMKSPEPCGSGLRLIKKASQSSPRMR